MNQLAFVFPFLFLVPVAAFAQSDPPKWQAEMSAGMGGAESITMFAYMMDESFVMKQEDRVSWFASVTRIIPIHGKLSLRTGLSFADQGFKADLAYSNSQAETWRMKKNQHLFYMGTPVIASVNTMKTGKKLGFLIEGGVLPQFLLSNNRPVIGQEPLRLAYSYRNFSLSGIVQLNIQYQVSESLTLFAGPQLRMALMDYDTGESSRQVGTGSVQIQNIRPERLGLTCGLRF